MPDTPALDSLMNDLQRNDARTLLQQQILATGKQQSWVNNQLVSSLLTLTADTISNPVHFLYVTDPYDIVEYCYPLGFRIDLEKIDGPALDILSDKLTAWERFFNTQPALLLLDEHRPEMARLRNRIVFELQEQMHEFEDFERLVKEIFSINDVSQLTKEDIDHYRAAIFEYRLPWLVAAATGELHSAPQRFLAVIKKLIYRESLFTDAVVAPWVKEHDRPLHLEKIAAAFYETQESERARELYMHKIDRLKARKIEVSDRREENLWADYRVADRILRINEALAELEEKLSCRYIVLFLSSDEKSKKLPQQLSTQVPKIFGHAFIPTRQVAHLWLNDLMNEPTNEGPGINQVKEEPTDKLIPNLAIAYHMLTEPTELAGTVRTRITALRNRLNWHGLMKNISALPGKLTEAFQQLENRTSFLPLKGAFTDIREALQRTSREEGLRYFQNTLLKYNIEISTFQKILNVLRSEPTPDISSRGYVVGINHHLPTLIEKTRPYSKYEAFIDTTIDFILSPDKFNNFGQEIRQLASQLSILLSQDDIPDLLQGVQSENPEKEIQHYERQTLLYLFALLLPATNLTNPYEDSKEPKADMYNLDLELDKWLANDINQLKKRIRQKVSPSLRILFKNMAYTRIWSLRRNNRFDECRMLIDTANTENWFDNATESIRLTHGTALLSYSELLDMLTNYQVDDAGFYGRDEGLSKCWKRAEKDSQRALYAYEIYDGIQFNKQVVDKAHSAILNTLIYLYVVGYQITPDVARLITARTMLDTKMKRFDVDRRRNPEYIHTEANLEYLEAFHLKQTNNKDKALHKIEHAHRAIKRCIEMNRKFFPHKNNDPDYIQLEIYISNFKKGLQN